MPDRPEGASKVLKGQLSKEGSRGAKASPDAAGPAQLGQSTGLYSFGEEPDSPPDVILGAKLRATYSFERP